MYLFFIFLLSISFIALLSLVQGYILPSFRHYITFNCYPMSSINVQLSRNFNLKEFYCQDGTPVPSFYFANVLQLAINLQSLRDFLGTPIIINSAYRTEAYNKKIGGVDNSQHLLAKAADIQIKGVTPIVIASSIEMLIIKGRMKQGGIGIYDTFVHYDVRGTHARWDYRAHKLSIPE